MNHDLLRQLYKTYHREIYLYLYSLCKNHEVAQDLMQDTFVKAILSLSDKHNNMRAWLYLVARNLYFNYSKKERRNVLVEDIGETITANTGKHKQTLLGISETNVDGIINETARRGGIGIENTFHNPLEYLLHNERQKILYEALQHLEETKREVLTLQYFVGMSQKEIAGLLKKTPENVRILSHRGKLELRKYMEANGYDIS